MRKNGALFKEAELPWQEWAFSKCGSDLECKICWHYEIARMKLKEKDYLKLPLNRAYSARLAGAGGFALGSIIFSLVEFPLKPWLAINPARRSSVIKAFKTSKSSLVANWLAFDAIFNHKLSKLTAKQAERFYPLVNDYYDPDKRHAFVAIDIDWERNNDELKFAFDRLLGLRPVLKERRGRVSYGDKLRSLAAWRLLKHFRGVDEALKHILKLEIKPPYGDETGAWQRARKRFETLYPKLDYLGRNK